MRERRARLRALRRAERQVLHSVCGLHDADAWERVEEELAVVKRKGWRQTPALPLRIHVRWLLARRKRLELMR